MGTGHACGSHNTASAPYLGRLGCIIAVELGHQRLGTKNSSKHPGYFAQYAFVLFAGFLGLYRFRPDFLWVSCYLRSLQSL